MFILLLSFFATHAFSFKKVSLFGHPGTDEVEIDYVDGFEILETNIEKPTVPAWVPGYFSSITDKNDYPWPGHKVKNYTIFKIMREESRRIHGNFSSNKVNQKNLPAHPVAWEQYETEDIEAAKNAPRIKARITICPNFYRHVPPLFIPPGEAVKMEIFEGSKTVCQLL